MKVFHRSLRLLWVVLWMAAFTSVLQAQDCVYAQDTSTSSQPGGACAAKYWTLKGYVYSNGNGNFDIWGGSATVENACYGNYTRCDGGYESLTTIVNGSKQLIYYHAGATTTMQTYWFITSRSVYYNNCVTPSGGQGYLPVVLTTTYSTGFNYIHCNN